MRDSQIVQAAWPWVLYERQPVAARVAPLKLAAAGELFDDWCVTMTARRAQWLYQQTHAPFFILLDSTPITKGREPWTENSRQADLRFALLGLAYRSAPGTLAAAIFPRPCPSGQLGHAQVMLYNGLPQRPPSGKDNTLQPEVGWDTLNWTVRVAKYPALAPIAAPQYRADWRARLMPVTRLDDAVATLEEPFREPVAPLVPAPREFQTH